MSKEVLVEDQTTKVAMEEIQREVGKEGDDVVFKVPTSENAEEMKEVKVADEEDDNLELKAGEEEKETETVEKDDDLTFKVDGEDVKLEQAAKAVKFVRELNGDNGLRYLQLIANKAGLKLVNGSEEVNGQPKEAPANNEEKFNYEELLGEEGASLGPGITKLMHSVMTDWSRKELIPRLNTITQDSIGSKVDIAKEKLSTRYEDYDDLSLEVETLLEDYPHKRGTMVDHLDRLYKMAKVDKGATIIKKKRTERIRKNRLNDPGIRSTDLEDGKVKTMEKEPESVEQAVTWAFNELMSQ